MFFHRTTAVTALRTCVPAGGCSGKKTPAKKDTAALQKKSGDK
ncbi:MAG: hypothetical protein ABSF80_03695 [Chitinispirillaceae bacterium]|jgi:hypothetical protein